MRCRFATWSIRLSVRRRFPEVAGYETSPSTITTCISPPAPLSRREKGRWFVKRFILCHHFANVEAIFHPSSSGETHLVPARRIGEKRVHRLSHCCGIARRD